jgi:hypothetical protein
MTAREGPWAGDVRERHGVHHADAVAPWDRRVVREGRAFVAVHGSVPCVVASEKSKTSPASSFGLSTNSLSASYRCTLGGHGRFALWLPRMTQNPPSPGFVGVNATLAARRRLYIFPPSYA